MLLPARNDVIPGYVYRLLRLPSLAPDIITAIINGKNPPQLTAKKLMRLTPQIPVDWANSASCLAFTHYKRALHVPTHVRQAWLCGFLNGSTILTELKVDPQMPPERLS